MRKVRVLIVDDSTVIRRLLTESLTTDPDIEIVGTAANGKIALSKIPQVNPDIVTLDIEMPEMDGLATLAALRREYPRLPVIMFSTLTAKGALATINALSLGASDYVTKPSNVGSITAGIQSVRSELLPKIKALCSHFSAVKNCEYHVAGVRPPTVVNRFSASVVEHSIKIIAIGVSTGGPNALAEIFPMLPADLPVPVVVVQHMPPLFTKYLADRLDQSSQIQVREARGGEPLLPGAAWIAPGDYHLCLVRNGSDVRTRIIQTQPENSCRPAVDVLFRSVAEIYGPNSLAVVLTGMGHDGQHGCEAIRDAGGRVIAQDEATSVVWGMPGSVVHSGLANEVLPLNRIAQRLSQIAQRSRTAPQAAGVMR